MHPEKYWKTYQNLWKVIGQLVKDCRGAHLISLRFWMSLRFWTEVPAYLIPAYVIEVHARVLKM